MIEIVRLFKLIIIMCVYDNEVNTMDSPFLRMEMKAVKQANRIFSMNKVLTDRHYLNHVKSDSMNYNFFTCFDKSLSVLEFPNSSIQNLTN